MRLRGAMRGASVPFATLLVAGALVFGVPLDTHDGRQEVDNWHQAQAAWVAQGPQGSAASNAPRPPATFVLVEESGVGSALGAEIAALAQHLGRASVDTLGSQGEEALETFHEVICLAISWLLENRVDPGGPWDLARIIDADLAARELPHLDYSKVRRDLERLYLITKEAQTTDEIVREVAEAILC
jgi:hypothetical protein